MPSTEVEKQAETALLKQPHRMVTAAETDCLSVTGAWMKPIRNAARNESIQ